ncbi:hypothetical protein Hamer_G013303 [Homarus americanus]|uniref:Uncharacterized protein n=1 Tax=Homarus americanus TaxID=6706 RepID=A0A8J5K591_HOMAM|nr:hypothetical protein Hamer_G013303 [Homarus americanus]
MPSTGSLVTYPEHPRLSPSPPPLLLPFYFTVLSSFSSQCLPSSLRCSFHVILFTLSSSSRCPLHAVLFTSPPLHGTPVWFSSV